MAVCSRNFILLLEVCMLGQLKRSSYGLPMVAPPVNNTAVLSQVINKAVNDSLTTLGSSTANLSTVLVSQILQEMLSKGIQLTYIKKSCQAQQASKLAELFYSQRGLNCVTLSKLNLPRVVHERDTYIVTSDNNCLITMEQDPVCFPQDRKALCGTNTSTRFLENFNDDHFPRMVSELRCSGCKWERGHSCQTCGYFQHEETFRLLKRVPNECDEDGKEKWIIDNQTVTVGIGCSCLGV